MYPPFVEVTKSICLSLEASSLYFLIKTRAAISSKLCNHQISIYLHHFHLYFGFLIGVNASLAAHLWANQAIVRRLQRIGPFSLGHE